MDWLSIHWMLIRSYYSLACSSFAGNDRRQSINIECLVAESRFVPCEPFEYDYEYEHVAE